MNQRQIHAHMNAAYVYAGLSYCERLKVGCLIVRDNRTLSIGYNGTPAGECNMCESEDGLSTLPSVIHAEDNALRKLQTSPETSVDATMFITTSPCLACAKMIHASRIKEVYYNTVYRDLAGVQYLQARGIAVVELNLPL